jgi:hypothetical protein
MKNKLKQIIKLDSQSNIILNEEIEKKNPLKKVKKTKSSGLTCQTCDSDHKMETT